MKRKRLILLGLAVTLLTLAPARDSSAQRYRRLRCSDVRVSSPDVATITEGTEGTEGQRGKKGQRGKSGRFSAGQILDLELEVRLPARQFTEEHVGQHKVELKLYTPSGNLYQTLTLPFVVDGSEGANNARYMSASTMFPVAGTSIVTSSLYGEWTIRGFVDGNAKSCGKTTRIELNP